MVEPDLLEKTYPEYEHHRKNIRNQIHHPKASEHDTAHSKKRISAKQKEESFNETASNFFNLWADIKVEDAENAINGVENYIKTMCIEIKKLNFSPNSNIRRDMLHNFIDIPLNHIISISGSTKIIEL